MSSSSSLFTGPIPTLTDGRVTLRAFVDADRKAVAEHVSDPQMRRWMAVPQPFTDGDTDAWPTLSGDGRITDERCQFAIESEGRLIGDVNLSSQEPGTARISFGLTAAYRGQGLMSRALRLALTWGFREAGIEVVHWRAEVGNWESRRVAWAVGFSVLNSPVAGLLPAHETAAHESQVHESPAPGSPTQGSPAQGSPAQGSPAQGSPVDGWLGTLRRDDPLRPRRPWYGPVPLRDDTVVLRAHQERDVPRMVEACLDPQTQYWLSGLPVDYSTKHAQEHLDQIRTDHANGRAMYWAVADPDDNRLLGELAIFVLDPQDPYGEVGYWAHPDARARGVTTAAVRLAVRHALLPAEEGGLGLPRVLLRAGASNTASLRVAERIGFTRVGRDRHAHLNRDGSRSDNLRFDLLADELPAVR